MILGSRCLYKFAKPKGYSCDLILWESLGKKGASYGRGFFISLPGQKGTLVIYHLLGKKVGSDHTCDQLLTNHRSITSGPVATGGRKKRTPHSAVTVRAPALCIFALIHYYLATNHLVLMRMAAIRVLQHFQP